MARTRRWQDLSPRTRAAVLAIGSVQVSLLAAAQVDISRRPAERINGSKLTWRLISMINIVGPILYFVLGRRRRSLS